MSSIAVNAITDANGGNTTSINNTTPNAYNTIGKNLVINGAMQIAQRYGYNSPQTNWNNYDASDRFFKKTAGNATSSVQTRDDDAPSGFIFSDKLTITSQDSDTYIGRGTCLEWNNISHLRGGYSDAKTITLTFWVKASISGTYCFAYTNYDTAYNGTSAATSYVAEYTVTSANTWEQKTITVTLPTSTPSNWDGSNGKNAIGLRLQWSVSRQATTNTFETATTDSWISGTYFCTSNQTNMGATNGSTFQITGVQLEVGESATEFEHRPYTTELSLCQRYYFVLNGNLFSTSYSTASLGNVFHPVTMRTTPSYSATTNSASHTLSPQGTNIGYIYKSPGSTSAVVGLAGDAEL